MSQELYYKEVCELSDMLAKKEISALELAKVFVERTAAVEDKVGAMISCDENLAMKMAEESDARRAEGKTLGSLDGIPMALKDVLALKNSPLTCASKMLENFISPYTGTVVSKLEEAGSVFWGRTNLDEFAMGSSCENSALKTTKNPWDLSRIAGGSSGGSAAALAAGECACALGSDTGGSIRQPASHCGVVGMKPTYGVVSRYGLAAFASSLDQIGPITRSVRDAALILNAIAGHDKLDSTSVKMDYPDYLSGFGKISFKGKKIGVPKEYFGDGISSEVAEAVKKAISQCAELGAEIVEISLPHTELAVPVYYIISTAEASSNLARFDGIRYGHRSQNASDLTDLYFKSRSEGFGEEVKRRIILGSYVLSSGYYDAYYLRAQKVRTLIRRDFEQAFENVDIIMTPTSPNPAFKIGEKSHDLLAMYLSDIYTINVNLAGLPGISLPCGFSSEGMPMGFQMIGKAFCECELLALADAYQASTDFHKRRPNI